MCPQNFVWGVLTKKFVDCALLREHVLGQVVVPEAEPGELKESTLLRDERRQRMVGAGVGAVHFAQLVRQTRGGGRSGRGGCTRWTHCQQTQKISTRKLNNPILQSFHLYGKVRNFNFMNKREKYLKGALI